MTDEEELYILIPEGANIPKEFDIWLVWELNRTTQKTYLRAVVTSDFLALIYKQMILKEARCFNRPVPHIYVEKTRANHLYGARER